MTETKKIRVLVIPVGKPPEVREIEDSLEGMYAVCGDPIQMVPYLDGAVDMVCNEEGKFNGLKPNRPAWEGYDLIFGDFFFAGSVDSEGESTSLTDEQIDKLTKEFA